VVTVGLCRGHEITDFRQDKPSTWRFMGDGDAAPPAELQEPLVAKLTQRPEHGVGIDAKHGGQILRWWKPLPRAALALRDGPAERGGSLLMQRHRVCKIELDKRHNAIYSSTISGLWETNMAVVEEHETLPRAVSPDASADGSLLIEEARSRQRRRQLRIVVAGLVAGSLAAGLAVGLGRDGSHPAQVVVDAPQFANRVAAATTRAGSARVSIVLGASFPRGFLACRTPTTGTGTINFKGNSIGLTLVNPGGSQCGTPFVMLQRQIGTQLYMTDPSDHRVLTSPGKPWLKTPNTSPDLLPGFGNGGIHAGTTAGFLFTMLQSIHDPVTPIGTKTLNGASAGHRDDLREPGVSRRLPTSSR
jgi:hypothetical protein